MYNTNMDTEGKILLNTKLRQNLKISLDSYCLYTLGRTSLELIIICLVNTVRREQREKLSVRG